MIKEVFEDSVYRDDSFRQEPWRELNNLTKRYLKGEYAVLFHNTETCDKIPSPYKFIVFGWEELKILIYREPRVYIYTFKNYNHLLATLKFSELNFIKEGLRIENETNYKRAFLFKDLDKQTIKVLNKGERIIKVGDFLSTCWGYDQTNTELFIIKKVIGKNYLIIQEVAQQIARDTDSPVYDMVKVSDNLRKIDLPIKAYISNDGYMSICEHGYKRGLSITSMNKEHYKTNSQYGH